MQRYLDQGFVDPWDSWLQQAIYSARLALGDRWTECYFSAPIWRFALAPGICGPTGMIGVLMPSVDSVGRHFPLTLAAPSASPDPWAALSAAAPLCAALERAALDTLDEGAGRAALDTALAASPTATAKPSFDTILANRWVRDRFTRPSVWRCEVDGRCHALLHEGLPSPARALTLFNLDSVHWSGPDAEVIA